MTYQQHEELFLYYDARIQNNEFKSQQEKKFLQLHAFTHEVLAAKRLPDTVLAEVIISATAVSILTILQRQLVFSYSQYLSTPWEFPRGSLKIQIICYYQLQIQLCYARTVQCLSLHSQS
jgi:hypothetical protein